MADTTELAGLFSSLAGSVGGAVGSLGAASALTFTSNFSPPVTFTPGAGGQPAASGTGAGFPPSLNPLAWLQPQIALTVNGVQLPPVAPYGQPDGNYLPRLVTLGGVVGGLGLLAIGQKGPAKTAFIAAGVGFAMVLLGINPFPAASS